MRRHTLIIVRRILAEPKTALAGVMLTTSFVIFMASMVAFNDVRMSSRRFCCLEFGSIVELVIAVWDTGYTGEPEL